MNDKNYAKLSTGQSCWMSQVNRINRLKMFYNLCTEKCSILFFYNNSIQMISGFVRNSNAKLTYIHLAYIIDIQTQTTKHCKND